MFKKISLIVFLAILLGSFLVLRPYFTPKEEKVALINRLPDADFLARAKLLGILDETSGMLFYHKVPFRDFLSDDFILAQAKTYGLQLQNHSYIIANEDASFGVLVELTDSLRVGEGVKRLRKHFQMKDTLIGNQKVTRFTNFNGYIAYGEDYLFFYKGNQAKKHILRVVKANKNQISPHWRELLNDQLLLSKNLAIYCNWKTVKEATVEKAMAYTEIDSTHITLHSRVKMQDTIPFKLKHSGENLRGGMFSQKQINLHLNIERLRNNKQHPLYQYLVQQGQKISFPTDEFLQNWSGDLSFDQGGLFTIIESYIETEMDENFNLTEVKKWRRVKVPGFTLVYNTLPKGERFFDVLLKKGVLTKQERSYYFLLSPPLSVTKNDSAQQFYSSNHRPILSSDSTNSVLWTVNYTPYEVTLDSASTFECFGRLTFPMGKILERNNLVAE